MILGASFGLSDLVVQKIGIVFQTDPKVDEVIIYGSRAKGNFRPGSDIDLSMRGPRLTHADLLRISEALDELMLPYQIDLSLLHEIDNEDFLNHIERVGKRFYLRDESAKT